MSAPAWEYPQAHRLGITDHIHGQQVADPYRWLEDPADPRTRTWVAQQRAVLDQWRDDRADHGLWEQLLQQSFAQEVMGSPCPRPVGDFFLRRQPGQEHVTLCLAEAAGRPRVLIDPMELDPAGTTVLDAFTPSPSGYLVAYQLSATGTEASRIHVLETSSGTTIDGPTGHTRYSAVAWTPDGSALYYADALPDADGNPSPQPQRVRFHRIGESAYRDRTVFIAPGSGWRMVHRITLDAAGHWLSVVVRHGASAPDELWIAAIPENFGQPVQWQRAPLGAVTRTFMRFGRPDVTGEPRAYLHTTGGAQRGRIVVAAPGDLAMGRWRELIPDDPGATIRDFAVLDGLGLHRPLMAVTRSRHGISELILHDAQDGEAVGRITLPGSGVVTSLSTRPRGGHELWFVYTDFTTVPAIYHYDARADIVTVAPYSHDVNRVHVRRASYTSSDGMQVGMFILAPEETPSRPRPAMLTAYGGFGISMEPVFTPTVLPWITAGGVCAVACVRGGGEEGRAWHLAGTGAGKQQAIADFHAAADWLVENCYTTRDQLGVTGTSNGGLLVAAAITQRPESYAAAVCVAPLADMIRYERSGLGQAWTSEYGTAMDPEQFQWLIAYSPYHHVKPGTRYPAVLIAAFDEDRRVDPSHARKFAAALQHATNGPGPVFFRSESGVGHAQRSTSRVISLSADALAFLADRVGLRPSSPPLTFQPVLPARPAGEARN